MTDITAPVLGDLPAWDLSHLYAAPDCPELEDDLARAATEAKAFHDSLRQRLATLDGAGLGRAIADYERISETLSRLYTYAQLRFSAAVGDPEAGRFFQTIQERVNVVMSDLLFFGLEINRLDEAVLDRQLEDPTASRYRPWVRDQRLFREHQLSDELEKYMHEKTVAGRQAWTRLFDETLAGLRIGAGKERLRLSEALNRLSDMDADKRRTAAKGLGRALNRVSRLLMLITNTLVKDKEVEDKWRHYPKPISERNLANRVEDEVVDALANSVVDAYPRLGHRYYALKARWFGVKQLEYWDRNAPLPGDEGRVYGWEEARTTVLDAYRTFSPTMAEVAERFFSEGWIDAAPRRGKDSGAFSHPAVPSVHPYILMNFHGKARDVMTLAHELGHGVHQVLASAQGLLLADTPLTLAETASVFGEMLTFRALLAAESDPSRRKRLLAGKVEDMMNTVVRQIAFHRFETRVHAERRSGELSTERLGEIWFDIQRESLGPAFRFDRDYAQYWSYIPHFVHTPFYVYAYAFGDCLVNSLYGVYAEGHEGFEDKYLTLLRAGGTLRHRELLAPFGLDATDPGFWKRGMDVVSEFIDELETME